MTRRRSLAQRVASLRDSAWAGRLERSPVGRIAVALYEINMRDRALTLAGQAFIALVPLLIVVATALSASDGIAFADWLIEKFALEGTSAQAVRLLFTKPPDATGGISVVGFVILLVSVSSFAKSVQRTYEVAWRLPARGLRRTLNGWGGATVLLLALGGLAYVNTLVDAIPGGRLVTLLLQTAVIVPVWWLVTRVLLCGRVDWFLLLPGAVISALGQVLVSWGGSIWIPYLIERNATRYGVIGVAVALISWLVVLAFLVVFSAVLGAQLGALLARARGEHMPVAESGTRRHPADPGEWHGALKPGESRGGVDSGEGSHDA